MFYDRLKKACKNANTTVTATLKAIGIGTANGTYWKNGSAPSSDVVVKLSEFLGVSTDYLLIGKEGTKIDLPLDAIELISAYNSVDIVAKAMIKERALTLAELAAEREAKERADEQSKKAVEIPVSTFDEQSEPEDDEPEQECIKIMHSYYKVSAGRGFDLTGDEEWEEIEIPATYEANKADYALTIQGDSMEPIYYDGDIVLIKKQDLVEIGQIGIFVLDGSGFIKKFNGDRLISLNDKYDDILLKDYSDCRCDGRVIGRVKL